MQPLTVLIPCKNEAENIRACIESVRPMADEILVADSLSSDATLDIVRQAGGCRIVERVSSSTTRISRTGPCSSSPRRGFRGRR